KISLSIRLTIEQSVSYTTYLQITLSSYRSINKIFRLPTTQQPQKQLLIRWGLDEVAGVVCVSFWGYINTITSRLAGWNMIPAIVEFHSDSPFPYGVSPQFPI